MTMRRDTDHKEQLDDFSEFMKRKLEDHRLPVDDLCWEEIEPCMKSRGRGYIWWIGSAVAAAIAVMLLLLPFQMEEKLSEQLNEQATSVLTEEENASDTIAVSPDEAVSPVDKRAPAEQWIAVAPVKQPIVEAEESPEEAVADWQSEVAQKGDQVVESSTREPEKEKKRESQRGMGLNQYGSKKQRYALPDKKRKTRKEWSVNASLGTGGAVSLNLLGGDNYSTNSDMESSINPGPPVTPPVVDPPYTDSGMIPAENYSDIACALPLSFGMTVRKDFNRYIGLETGLVYTYLSSRMSQGGKLLYNSRLNLHYLGVPVNLVVSLWNHPKWNIYLSGGVMLEKGLRSKQTQQSYALGDFETLVEKKGISGVQWSLNGSVGISYRLYREWSLYLEPRISYYFDNGQPVSIRTENSAIVGLGAGFRFEF